MRSFGVAAAGRHGWRQIEERLTARRAGFHQPASAMRQIVVGRERVIDEVVERVVAKLCPELRLRLVCRVHRRLGAGEFRGRGRIGALVVSARRRSLRATRDDERNAGA